MRFNRGEAARFLGKVRGNKHYNTKTGEVEVTSPPRYSAGAIVVGQNGHAFISKMDGAVWGAGDKNWADLGRMGASPTKVMHAWHGEPLQYPAGDSGELSEMVEICSDCWKDADYKNAFEPMKHLYVIRTEPT